MSEWRETTLGEVALFQNGYPFKPSELGGASVPVIRIKQLLDPVVEFDFASIDVPEKFHISDGDLIFSWSARLASVIWDRGHAFLNQHLFRVSPRGGIDLNWLHHYLEDAVDLLLSKAHGTTMKHVTKKVLESHAMRLPSLIEQRRIVGVIESVDKQIKILTVQASHAEKALNRQREAWPTSSETVIGDLLIGLDTGKSILTGGDEPVQGLPRILKLSAIQPGFFNPSKAKLLPPGNVGSSLVLVEEGDLLITRSNTPERVGFCAVARQVPDETYIPDLIWRLRVDKNICRTDYLEHTLASSLMRSRITSTASGTNSSMQKINKRSFAIISLPLPSLEKQKEYASLCDVISNILHATKVEICRLRDFRSVLLSNLLSQSITIPEAYDALLDVVPAGGAPEDVTA